MKQKIKPIEARYDGHVFRSQIEAKWACFFKTLGLKYVYEGEAYETPCGTWYMPDFYLPDLSVYAEVKGNCEGVLKALPTLESAASPDGFASNGLIILTYDQIESGMRFLGYDDCIPFPIYEMPAFTALYADGGKTKKCAVYFSGAAKKHNGIPDPSTYTGTDGTIFVADWLDGEDGEKFFYENIGGYSFKCAELFPHNFENVLAAYAKAKALRFDHATGEIIPM